MCVTIVDYIYMHTHGTVWSPHNNTLYLKMCNHFIAALCSPLFNSMQLSIAPAQPDLSVELHRLVTVCTYTDNVCIRIYTVLHLHTQGHTRYASPVRCVHTHTHTHPLLETDTGVQGHREKPTNSAVHLDIHAHTCSIGYTATEMQAPPFYTHNQMPPCRYGQYVHT